MNTIQKSFESQVRKTPNSIAIIFEGQKWTYDTLNSMANQIAQILISNGVLLGDHVLISMDRSLNLVVSILAVLKAGGTYVPCDLTLPVNRLCFILEDSKPKIIMVEKSEQAIRATLRESAINSLIIDVSTIAAEIAQTSDANFEISEDPSNVAYVIYTSGSTGTPKGVMIEQHSVLNRLSWMQSKYKLCADDVVLQKTPVSFDVSVWELFWPLLNGARLVLAAPDGHMDPEYLAHVISEECVTNVHFIPFMLSAFVDACTDMQVAFSLKRVICSGESLSLSLARRFGNCFPGVELHNLYGPTEATIDVTAWQYLPEAELISIGKAIDNTKIYILDSTQEPVPIGAIGELYIAGKQLARGYLNQPGLTSQAFLRDRFSSDTKSRMYKTGDRGRFLPDGNIEFLGRLDQQVKIRGYRIELGEIESKICEFPGIVYALVIVRDQGRIKDGIFAYYSTSNSEAINIVALQSYLASYLPYYMIPLSYHLVDRVPLTHNGKVDRVLFERLQS